MSAPQQSYPPREMQQPLAPQSSYQPMPSGGAFWYQPPKTRGSVKTNHGTNQWSTDMIMSCTKDPQMCAMALFCPHLCVMQQRKKLLMDDLNNYQCCAGIFGPRCTDRLTTMTRGNEPIAVCLESFFCLSCALHGNRWMVMQHYNLQNDCMDIVFMYLGYVCRIVAMLARNEHLENLASCAFYATAACMLAQHNYQMTTQGYPVGQVQVMA